MSEAVHLYIHADIRPSIHPRVHPPTHPSTYPPPPGPTDYAKKLKLRFRVGDLDVPERRYTSGREEEDVAKNVPVWHNNRVGLTK